MNVLDLFSGIGGFSLGLERAGMRTVAFCEIEPFPQAVLRKHWPNIPIYEDIRTLTAKRLAEDAIPPIDLICGGFPCQDISVAGKGAGIEGERSGLWSEYARLIGEIQPRFVIVENVAAFLGRGIDRVLGDLAALGFDAEWHCIPASAVGASHKRERVWIIAYSDNIRRERLRSVSRSGIEGRDAIEGLLQSEIRMGLPAGSRGRTHDGLPNRLDRLKSLGNAVVPQIPEIIGRAIMQAECLGQARVK